MIKFTTVLLATIAIAFWVNSNATLMETFYEADFNPLKMNSSFKELYEYGGKFGNQGSDKYSSNTDYA